MESREVRQKYDAFAPSYDLAVGLIELLGVSRLRRGALARARGKVLEVAIGTGKSLMCYPPGCDITGVDLSREMLERALRRMRRLDLPQRCVQLDAHELPFPDAAFDTVVDTLCLCTYADPVAVLREMARVCRNDGRLLLLEHGRSNRPWLGRLQDRWAPRHQEALGCVWNREPQVYFPQAGLRLVTAQRTFLGVFHVLEACPLALGRAG